jgi:hypothetical protein
MLATAVVLTVIIGARMRLHQEPERFSSVNASFFNPSGAFIDRRKAVRRPRRGTPMAIRAIGPSVRAASLSDLSPVGLSCRSSPPGGQVSSIERDNRHGRSTSISRRDPLRISRRPIPVSGEAAQGIISGVTGRCFVVRNEFATHRNPRASRPGTGTNWRLAGAASWTRPLV